jgi:hypothetical protein
MRYYCAAKPVGWMGPGQDGWGQFAYLDGISDNTLMSSNVSYVLMVSNAAHEQGYEVDVCRRLGVAAIQSDCLPSSSSRAVWVI